MTFCKCKTFCGDDGDTDGDGVCRLLPIPPPQPVIEIVMVPRRAPVEEARDSYGRGDD